MKETVESNVKSRVTKYFNNLLKMASHLLFLTILPERCQAVTSPWFCIEKIDFTHCNLFSHFPSFFFYILEKGATAYLPTEEETSDHIPSSSGKSFSDNLSDAI